MTTPAVPPPAGTSVTNGHDLEDARLRAARLTAPRTLGEILSNPDSQKPPAVVVPGLAWEGRLTLVAAREGVGKSTLLAAAAASVTTGSDFLGQPCARGAVLWVLVEEHLNDLVVRAVRFQTEPDMFHVLERPALPLASLAAAVEQVHPALVIIDTVHRFASVAGVLRDAHAADSWGPLMTALDKLARTTGTAILMSAQSTKSTGEYRDSTEIGHGVDVVLNLVRPDKQGLVRRLANQKARWPLEDVTFHLVGDRYEQGAQVAKKLTPQRQKVLDALEPPMTYGEWMEAAGVAATTFERSVKFLVSQDYVTKNGDAYGLSAPITPKSPPMEVTGVERELPPPPHRAVGHGGGGNAGGGHDRGSESPAPDQGKCPALSEGV